tara:strand:- start:133 stop:456 length:324 start_codon:yes stop_codon:yes gene_type:complete
MAKYNHNINGNIVPFTAEEEAARDAEIQAWNDGKLDRKKSEMRKLRNQYLKDTDWWVISEQITDAQKTWRQNLRNLPADNTTLEKVELVLARDSEGKLTHSIWTKPS